jgi:hypothetical protein
MNVSKFVADYSSSFKATKCLSVEPALCDGSSYADHYDDASASLVILCVILLFFMRSGFLYVELAFSMTHKRRRVVLAKYCDLFAGTLGFWLFGFAISGSTDAKILGAEQDFIFWFLRVCTDLFNFLCSKRWSTHIGRVRISGMLSDGD